MSLSMLLEIEENHKIIKEGIKTLKNGSCIYILRKLKLEFENEKVRFKEKEKELIDIKFNIEALNIRVNDIKEELKKIEEKVYNEYANNWCLVQRIQKDIEFKKDIIKEFNNNILKLLESKEKVLSDKEKLRLKLIELKDGFLNCKKVNNEKINRAKEDIKKAEHNIKNIENVVPKKLLSEFNSIRKIKGTGVARLRGRVCSECKVYVSAMVLNDIQKGKRLVCCDNCGRILYYNDMAELKKAK